MSTNESPKPSGYYIFAIIQFTIAIGIYLALWTVGLAMLWAAVTSGGRDALPLGLDNIILLFDRFHTLKGGYVVSFLDRVVFSTIFFVVGLFVVFTKLDDHLLIFANKPIYQKINRYSFFANSLVFGLASLIMLLSLLVNH